MNRQPNRILKIKHINIQSLKSKLPIIKHYLAKTKTDILSISETWLTKLDSIFIDNYDIIRLDRQTSGGGACIIIHKSIAYSVVTISGPIDIQHVTIKLHACIRAKHDLFITSLYIPPQTNIESNFFLKFFQGTHSLLLGDLNAHHPTWLSNKTNNTGTMLHNLQTEAKIIMLNNSQATYAPLHRPDYQSILDFALCTEPILQLINGFSITDELRTDHLTIQFNLDTKNNNYSRPQIEIKTTHRLNIDTLDQQLKQITFNNNKFNTQEELEEGVVTLTSKLQNAIETSTTSKIIRFNPDHHLQLPPFIVTKLKNKRKLERELKRTNNKQIKTQINKLNEIIQQEIIKYNSDKWKRQCTELNDYRVSDTKLWRKLEAIDNSTKPKAPKNPTIVINGTPVSDPRIVAEHFSIKQAEIWTEPQDPSFDQQFKQHVDNEQPHLFKRNEPRDQPILTTLEEINAEIKLLKHQKAPGPDKINNTVIKRLPRHIREQLVSIASASLELGYVPKIWKEAVVTMLPKPFKDKFNANSYRGISLLNTLSKILEGVALNRARGWAESNELLSKFQCGFRNFRQTKDQILRMIQDGIVAFNKNEYMGAILVDIEKAFDKVWHNGLLYELEQLKIPAYLGRWLRGYLSGRYFRIRIGKNYSSYKLILASVPQGSRIGPWAFIVYFNKISYCIYFSGKIPRALALFADDLAAWARAKRLKDIMVTLQEVLNNIEQWMNKWRMKVSVDKTIYTIFNKNKQDLSKNIMLTYKNKPLSYERNPKFLGVTLDPGLTLCKYVEITAERAQKRITLIKSIRGKNWGASSKLIMTTYKALVRPILEYVPFATLILPHTNYMKLERIQRAAVRTAFYWPQYKTTSDIYIEKNIQSIRDRAIKLSDRYICKAYRTNIIITELIDNYNILSEFDEGAHCKTIPRPTILGTIKKHNVVCKRYLVATTQSEQMEVYQQQFINNDHS